MFNKPDKKLETLILKSNSLTWKNSKIADEVIFKAVLSGGKGGQHTNKVSTKVELYWVPANSLILNEVDREIVIKKILSKLSIEGELRLICDEERSQFRNKKLILDKFYELLSTCFKIKKNRKVTQPTKLSVLRRLTGKSIRKEIKAGRRKFDI